MNLTLFVFNNFPLFFNSLNSNYKNKTIIQNKNFNFIDIKNNDSNIYIVLFDALPSLDYAEKVGIIDNKKKIVNELKKNNFNYVENFLANYPYTNLSIASLLNFSYYPEENQKIDKHLTMPRMLQRENSDINLFKILKPLKLKFLHIGNSWAPCIKTKFVNCYFPTNNFLYQAKFLANKLRLLYHDSLYNYFISSFNKLTKNKISNSIDIVKHKLDVYPEVKSINKGYNLIVFTHILSPHDPNMFDKDCNYKFLKANKDNSDEFRTLFKSTVKCLLKYMVGNSAKWSDNDNDIIIYLSDHGEHYELNNPDGYYDARHSAFFSYKMPKRCKNLPIAKSMVNVMAMALNCSHNLDLDYLEDYKGIY